jgi:hypothetical protein
MRKIKEVLRLCWAHGLSKRKTARSCGISRPAVDEYLRRAEEAGLSWPLPADLDEGALERLLFPATPSLPAPLRGLPDWSTIHRELKRKGVTLFLLWQEYRECHPQGYPSKNGTSSSAIRPWPMPSSTGWYTTLTRSISKGDPCANAKRN